MSEEQRQYLRIPARNRVFIELESSCYQGTSRANIAQCTSLDVSRTGLRVHVDQPVTVGAILNIGVDLQDQEDTLYLAGEVKWCEPHPESPENWVAGFELMNADQSDIDRWYTLWAILEE